MQIKVRSREWVKITEWKARKIKDKLSQAILQLETTSLSPALTVADEPGVMQMPNNSQRKIQAWSTCLLFILSPAIPSLKHLGSNSAKASEEKRKPGCLAGLHGPRSSLGHLKLAGDSDWYFKRWSQGWYEYFGYTALSNISKKTSQPKCPLALVHICFHSLCLSEISTLLLCCFCKDGKNRNILMLCCLHFPTLKKQPIIS